MPIHTVQFDVQSLHEIDALACKLKRSTLADDAWFSCFRGGLFGMGNRLRSVRKHYDQLHNWGLVDEGAHRRSQVSRHDIEPLTAVILFGMDSAVECMTFFLNALGYALEPSLFRDVTEAKELRQINPRDIHGKLPGNRTDRDPCPGYQRYFPTLQTHWSLSDSLNHLEVIYDLHDVSKHRQMIPLTGVSCRRDAPSWFSDALDEDPQSVELLRAAPVSHVDLPAKPKSHPVFSRPLKDDEITTLEALVAWFSVFLSHSGRLVLADLQNAIAGTADVSGTRDAGKAPDNRRGGANERVVR